MSLLAGVMRSKVTVSSVNCAWIASKFDGLATNSQPSSSAALLPNSLAFWSLLHLLLKSLAVVGTLPWLMVALYGAGGAGGAGGAAEAPVVVATSSHGRKA